MNKEISGFINLFKDILLEKCENIIGIYLFGSLAYVGFNEETSDIDLVIITKTLLNKAELENIRNIHKKLNEINIKWAKRLGVSYTPIDMLNEKIFQSYQNLITMRNFILKLLMETKG